MSKTKEVIKLKEGDQPYGDPELYRGEYCSAQAPREWYVNEDPEWIIRDFPLFDTEGNRLRGKWRVFCEGWGYTPTAWTTDKALPVEEKTGQYEWLSDPITNPTSGDLVDKVSTYLRETCDIHRFLESYYLDRGNRTIGVSLGS